MAATFPALAQPYTFGPPPRDMMTVHRQIPSVMTALPPAMGDTMVLDMGLGPVRRPAALPGGYSIGQPRRPMMMEQVPHLFGR